MKILVLNAGSSSLKFKLYEMPDATILAQGLIERIGEEESAIRLLYGERSFKETTKLTSHHEALERLETLLPRLGILGSFAELGAVGHRVVHGGEEFSAPVLVDERVLETIRRLIPLAPLHNPANLEGIEAFASLAPGVALAQVAVFDTAFHQTMAPEAYRYAVPEAWYRRYGVRRYGFHGTSHYYLSRRLARCVGRPIESLNAITLHLGNGASACALQGGKSVETSMGLTPLEGLVMGTRSGDLDPAILPYMHRQAGLSFDELERALNKAGGLKGLCGSNDMREVLRRKAEGEAEAALAFEVFIHRLVKYVGAYAAVLGRLDALVFSGGIGEHSPEVRGALCGRLGILGIEIDEERNRANFGRERAIHGPKSRVELWVIPTDEEGVIARESYRIVSEEDLSKRHR
ncbi:acetate/propionate family kinase [Nitratifractor sp.]